MHANWLWQQQIPIQQWCKWTSLKTSHVFIRVKFPVPIGKQTVSHCTLSWSGSRTKVYQQSFCQITTIMTRHWWYHTLCMFSNTSENTLETMFMILRSELMDLPVSLRIHLCIHWHHLASVDSLQGILELFSNKPWQRCCRWCWWHH